MDYLFNEWEKLKGRLKLKDLFLFFDYDGTLAPIARTPQQAVTPPRTKVLLETLLENPRFKIAIVSGRELKDIEKRVSSKKITYVGNHGVQIHGPGIKFSMPVSRRGIKILKHIKDDLAAKLALIKGPVLEDKGLSLSLHYRLVSKKHIPHLKAILQESVIPYLHEKKIVLRQGKKVFEICLPLNWDKGKAVLWILAKLKSVSAKNRFIPIYIGDDETDEDAFRALKNKGLTIFVGRPKPSYARYYLKNPGQVNWFLKRILSLKKA